MNNDKILKGNAGEYFVAGELSRRGFITAVPMSNVPNFDILAINKDTNKEFAIQVKTTDKNVSKQGWILSKKNEEIIGDNIIYIFVNWDDVNDPPKYYIVPSKDVARIIKKECEDYLSTHPNSKDVGIRLFSDKNQEYLNKWDLLN